MKKKAATKKKTSGKKKAAPKALKAKLKSSAKKAPARSKKTVVKKPVKAKKIQVSLADKTAVAFRSAEHEYKKNIYQPAPKEAAHVHSRKYRQDLPHIYGDNKIVAMVRDPYWVYSYWELTEQLRRETESKLSRQWNSLTKALRVYDVTGITFNGSNAHSHFDIIVNDYANNWYVNVAAPGRSYCIDIGVFAPDGRFITLARSNIVNTPRDSVSNVIDEEWMIPDDIFAKLYALSGGLRVGTSSAELKELMKKRLSMDLSSGAVSSMSSPSYVKKDRNFWLVVNTELIVYGATEPDAKLTVQNKPITLTKDGTFSLRFALPDGKQVIPVRATSKDKVDTKTITPIVARETKR